MEQKNMYNTVNCDNLAITIVNAFEEDRDETGINELSKGMDAVLQDYTDPERKQTIDHVFMALTGYTLETLVSMSR